MNSAGHQRILRDIIKEGRNVVFIEKEKTDPERAYNHKLDEPPLIISIW
jgi:hypothetical protein